MKYILGFFITILLLVLLIVLLVTGGDNKTSGPTTSKALTEYANTDSVSSLTIAGPINAQQEYRETRISVNRDTTTLEQIQGYQGAVTDLQTFPNSVASYEAFLRSIELAGFTKGDKSEKLKNDRGYCPLGTRYIFEFEAEGKQLERFWSTSCSGAKTYLGNTSLSVTLFKRQIPDFNRLDSEYARRISR